MNRTTHFDQLRDTLKRLGFARTNRIKLYGEEFELVADPVVVTEEIVFVDAVERRTRRSERLRIPLNIVNMASAQLAA